MFQLAYAPPFFMLALSEGDGERPSRSTGLQPGLGEAERSGETGAETLAFVSVVKTMPPASCSSLRICVSAQTLIGVWPN